jgi:hypothetical protein
MKLLALVFTITLLITLPTASHAIGILKYLCDAAANQLGLDRGPVPKVIPKRHPLPWDKYGNRIPRHVYVPDFHLQAEGF